MIKDQKLQKKVLLAIIHFFNGSVNSFAFKPILFDCIHKKKPIAVGTLWIFVAAGFKARSLPFELVCVKSPKVQALLSFSTVLVLTN